VFNSLSGESRKEFSLDHCRCTNRDAILHRDAGSAVEAARYRPDLPHRPGLATGKFNDVARSHHEYIDYVKFGWCTALVTAQIAP
jgi:hypothetical protein